MLTNDITSDLFIPLKPYIFHPGKYYIIIFIIYSSSQKRITIFSQNNALEICSISSQTRGV